MYIKATRIDENFTNKILSHSKTKKTKKTRTRVKIRIRRTRIRRRRTRTRRSSVIINPLMTTTMISLQPMHLLQHQPPLASSPPPPKRPNRQRRRRRAKISKMPRLLVISIRSTVMLVTHHMLLHLTKEMMLHDVIHLT